MLLNRTTRQRLVPRHSCARFILGWTARSETLTNFGDRFACACIYYFFFSSSARRWSFLPIDVAVLPQRSERRDVSWRPLIACRPTASSFSHCENNPDSSAHSPCGFFFADLAALPFASPPCRRKAEVVALCKFWHFMVSVSILSVCLYVAAPCLPSTASVGRLFQPCASVEAFCEISLCWQDFGVFHQWRQKRDANPLCSECGSPAVKSSAAVATSAQHGRFYL